MFGLPKDAAALLERLTGAVERTEGHVCTLANVVKCWDAQREAEALEALRDAVRVIANGGSPYGAEFVAVVRVCDGQSAIALHGQAATHADEAAMLQGLTGARDLVARRS